MRMCSRVRSLRGVTANEALIGGTPTVSSPAAPHCSIAHASARIVCGCGWAAARGWKGEERWSRGEVTRGDSDLKRT